MRNHRVTAIIGTTLLTLTLLFSTVIRQAQAQEQSSTAKVDDLKTNFEQFRKHGFGLGSVTNATDAVSTSGKGVNILDTLATTTQESALQFLRLPASGKWSGSDVDKAYELFMSKANTHDQDSSCGHFIKASYQFGKENYDACILELNLCLKHDPGYVPAYQMRALSEYKTGTIDLARKDWSKAVYLSKSTTTESAEAWVGKIVSSMKSNWKEEIAKQKQNQVHPTINIVVTIEKDGTITGTKITQSSGNAELDKLAQVACLKSSPVAPPPDNLSTPAEVLIGFEKRLER